MKIAVIGAGPAGLISAHILKSAGMKVTVFEARDKLGGTWAYDSRTERDPLGKGRAKDRVSSSMYEGLRTNLPREVMSFSSFPFDRAHVRGDQGEEFQTFPGHERVLEYLEAFARYAKLESVLRFNSAVQHLRMDDEGAWRLKLSSGETHDFQAVAVCNGHYSAPRVPLLRGFGSFTGRAIHSHNYRTSAPFVDRRVVILGAKASGIDIALEISESAKDVHLCARDPSGLRYQRLAQELQVRPSIRSINGSSVELEDGAWIHNVDDLVFCTGYEFEFPFLETGLLQVKDGYVRPLYKELLSLKETSLGLVGLPLQVAPFRLFEVQARYLAAVWSGSLRLPSESERSTWLLEHEGALRRAGLPRRHWLKHSERQFEYHDMLARECGAPRLSAAYIEGYKKAHRARMLDPKGYRDEEHPK